MTEVQAPRLALVVPCYNEQEILPVTAAEMAAEVCALAQAGTVAENSRIYLIDDGSKDATWSIITGLADRDPMFVGIRLTRNHGHQHALYAGLMEAEGDVLVSLDADGQDDIKVLGEMIAAWKRGNDIVYGVRSDRASDSLFKRYTAGLHYWLLERMGIRTVRNHADYRLLSRRAIELLSHYRETQLYLRGLIPLLGLPSAEVYYRRDERRAGVSKYSFGKMLSLSVKGITSFSIMPLRLISLMGLLVFTASICLGLWALHAAIWGEGTAPGWASTVIPIYLLGGLQLLAIGVAGEYIGKTFMEVKHRPLYQVDQVYRHQGSRRD